MHVAMKLTPCHGMHDSRMKLTPPPVDDFLYHYNVLRPALHASQATLDSVADVVGLLQQHRGEYGHGSKLGEGEEEEGTSEGCVSGLGKQFIDTDIIKHPGAE